MSGTVAVFGGSFNPPHAAHALVASYVLCCYDIDELLVVPTAVHPFGKPLAPFHHRLKMTQLTLRALHSVTVSDLEQRLGGTSHTLRTLRAAAVERPGSDLRLVIGTDILPSFPSWHRAEEVAALAPLLVVGRAGHASSAAEHLPQLPAISSTDIRQRVRSDASTQGLLAPAVAAYIAEHQLYRDTLEVDR